MVIIIGLGLGLGILLLGDRDIGIRFLYRHIKIEIRFLYVYKYSTNVISLLRFLAMALFCKICFDAKNEGYNTHNLRDKTTGKLTCKYLASLDCAYCGEKGHTPTHCLKKKKDASKNAGKNAISNKSEKRMDDEGGVVVTVGKIGKDIGKRDNVWKPLKGFMCLDVEASVTEDCEIEAEILYDNDSEEKEEEDLDTFILPDLNTIQWGSISSERWSD